MASDDSSSPKEDFSLEAGLGEVRQIIDKLTRAPYLNLTTLAAAIETAIAHGARLYNVGSIPECSTLYQQTASLLVVASQKESATVDPRTEVPLDDLTRALGRAKGTTDDNQAAWMMRHAFDKALVTQQLAYEELSWMMRLGEASFGRGDYAGSADAMKTAAQLVPALLAQPQPEPSIERTHLALFYYGHALILTDQFSQAYTYLAQALRLCPQIAEADFNLSALGPHYEAFVQKRHHLEDMDDANAQTNHAVFLRAYLHFFSDEQHRAQDLLLSHLRVDPNDEAAHYLLALCAAEAMA